MTRHIRALLAIPALLIAARLRILEAQHHIDTITEQRDRAIDCAERWKKEAERLREVVEARKGIFVESTER